jgi:hypothetical protein
MMLKVLTTNEPIVHPKDAPAKVLVRPFGIGKITSSIKANITIIEIKDSLFPAQSSASEPYLDNEVSNRVKGRTSDVNITIMMLIHLTKIGIFISIILIKY